MTQLTACMQADSRITKLANWFTSILKRKRLRPGFADKVPRQLLLYQEAATAAAENCCVLLPRCSSHLWLVVAGDSLDFPIAVVQFCLWCWLW